MAGICIRLAIYGKAGALPSNWKNALIGIVILLPAEALSLITDPLVRASQETSIAIALAMLLSVIVSDALA